MAEEFEDRDLSDAVFWGVVLHRATFRDVDFTGVRVSHSRLKDVEIDAEIDRLVVNGVDVTDYVNERDEWYPLRRYVQSTDPQTMRDGWRAFVEAWESAIGRAGELSEPQRHASVGGEWSFVQTLRHLVFATDKWFTAPVLGGGFDPLGLPNSGSVDFPWPDLDRTADPSFEGAVDAWRRAAGRVRDHLDGVQPEALSVEVAVLENGPHVVRDCLGVVFEEHFQHLRYATRDLALLG